MRVSPSMLSNLMMQNGNCGFLPVNLENGSCNDNAQATPAQSPRRTDRLKSVKKPQGKTEEEEED